MMNETEEQRRAFEFFCALGPKVRARGGVKLVADKFERTRQTVHAWKRELKWDDRVAEFDRAVVTEMKQADPKLLGQELSQVLGLNCKVVRKILNFVDDFDLDTLAIETPGDFRVFISSISEFTTQFKEVGETIAKLMHNGQSPGNDGSVPRIGHDAKSSLHLILESSGGGAESAGADVLKQLAESIGEQRKARLKAPAEDIEDVEDIPIEESPRVKRLLRQTT